MAHLHIHRPGGDLAPVVRCNGEGPEALRAHDHLILQCFSALLPLNQQFCTDLTRARKHHPRLLLGQADGVVTRYEIQSGQGRRARVHRQSNGRGSRRSIAKTIHSHSQQGMRLASGQTGHRQVVLPRRIGRSLCQPLTRLGESIAIAVQVPNHLAVERANTRKSRGDIGRGRCAPACAGGVVELGRGRARLGQTELKLTACFKTGKAKGIDTFGKQEGLPRSHLGIQHIGIGGQVLPPPLCVGRDRHAARTLTPPQHHGAARLGRALQQNARQGLTSVDEPIGHRLWRIYRWRGQRQVQCHC